MGLNSARLVKNSWQGPRLVKNSRVFCQPFGGCEKALFWLGKNSEPYVKSFPEASWNLSKDYLREVVRTPKKTCPRA